MVLKNLAAILLASGSDLDHVLKDDDLRRRYCPLGKVNEVYARVFGEHRPARSVVPTKELHFGFLLELEAIAAVKSA
jgi:2-iminobutanoate/2-iminopropanoate deaminase